MPSWDKDLIEAVTNIQNNAFFDGDSTIIFWFGENSEGDRYVNAEIVTGHIRLNREGHQSLGSIDNADDFGEALEELSKAHE